MIRLLGFLTGSALTIGAILMVIGLPELPEKSTDRVQVPIAAAPAAPSKDIESPPIDPQSELPDQDTLGATAVGADAVEAPAAAVEAPTEAPIEAGTLPADPAATAEPVAASESPHWHSFWNPFRSEIAANGFAARLRSVTGIDYRVVRLKPGSYQVAFAYGDESERRSKIEQIESATGLNLPEESL